MADQPNGRSPRRGRPPRISREQILAAARALPPENLTMQAVADRLDVDRTALHHHVSDREGLLELVAASVVASGLERIAQHVDDDWREALRAFTVRMRDVLIETGVLAAHFRFTTAAGVNALTAADRMLQLLADAGFGDDAPRVLTLAAQLAYGSARDVILSGHGHSHPQAPEVERIVNETAPDKLPRIRQLMGDPWYGSTNEQFAFSLAVLIEGLERRLPSPPNRQNQ